MRFAMVYTIVLFLFTSCSSAVALSLLRNTPKMPFFVGNQIASARQILSPRRRQKGSLELGIQTAQILMNEKKQSQFRQDMIQQYPLVPPFIIGAAVNTVASGFTQIAPETLKEALQPGGMDKFRPLLRDTMVEVALDQRAVRNFPLLNKKEKSNLVVTVVDMALDTIFADAEWVLASPQVRLEALEEEILSIKTMEMTRKQTIMYYLRRHPWLTLGRILGVTLLGTYIGQGSSWVATLQAIKGFFLTGYTFVKWIVLDQSKWLWKTSCMLVGKMAAWSAGARQTLYAWIQTFTGWGMSMWKWSLKGIRMIIQLILSLMGRV